MNTFLSKKGKTIKKFIFLFSILFRGGTATADNRRSPASRLVLMQNHDRQYEPDRDRKQPANGNNESITIQTNPNLPTNDTGGECNLCVFDTELRERSSLESSLFGYFLHLEDRLKGH